MTLGGVPFGAIVGDWSSHSLINNYDKAYTEVLWQLKLQQISYGNSVIDAGEAKYASLDSFTDYIYLSEADYAQFVQSVRDVSTDFDCPSHYLCHSNLHTCDYYSELLPDFIFQIDDILYTVPPAAYTQSFGDTKCNVLVLFREDLDESIILGKYFLQDFVTSFEYDTASIKIGLNVNSNDGAKISRVEVPQPKSLSWLPYLIVSLMILSFIAILLVVCMIRRKRSRFKTREADQVAYGPAHKQFNEIWLDLNKPEKVKKKKK